VIDGWDRNRSDLNGALLYNRKLWTVFLGSAMSDDNPLPVEIRQNVANLGMYIMSQTIAVTSDPKVEIVNSLVSINRELAAGLRGQG
jgi:flagellar protein FlaF